MNTTQSSLDDQEIQAIVKAMVQRTREGKVRPEDIEGSTFSISNLGMYDVSEFAAIHIRPKSEGATCARIRQG